MPAFPQSDPAILLFNFAGIFLVPFAIGLVVSIIVAIVAKDPSEGASHD